MLEKLKAALAAATPGEWKPCRQHEDFDGPIWELSEENRAEYEARPFTSIQVKDRYVTTNHDLFEFHRGDAEFITTAHNSMPNLIEAIEAMQAWVEFSSAHIGDRLPIREAQPLIRRVRDALSKLEAEKCSTD
jgi:hypothetical protein